MDDEPMWAANRVVALTLGFPITIPETANEFAIIDNHLTLVKGNQFDGRIKIDPEKHIHKFLRICDMFKYRDTKNEAIRLMMFPLSLIEEDFDALLDECSEILHSIKGTILKEKLFAEFDEFMAMNADENSESESNTEDPPFEKIKFNTD
nr:reverse transcriptase domain-containing protein [Tanacetum cinerariifolium]